MTTSNRTTAKPGQLLKLPGEVLNRIYRGVLVEREPHEGVASQFLATCKQIHKEASAILYIEHEVHITIRSQATDPPLLPLPYELPETTELRVHTHKWYRKGYGDRIPMLELPDGIDKWPSFLQRVERIHLTVELRGDHDIYLQTGEGPFQDVVRLLFSLTAFLEQGHRLKQLRIHVDLGDSRLNQYEHPEGDHSDASRSGLQSLLYPLRRFGWVANCRLTGLPQKDNKLFLRWMSHGPSYYDHENEECNHIAADETNEKSEEVPNAQSNVEPPSRPRLGWRWSLINEGVDAFLALPLHIQELSSWSDTDNAILHAQEAMWNGDDRGLSERNERRIVRGLEAIRQSLDNYHDEIRTNISKDALDAEPEYLDFARAALERKAIWALDDYEVTEIR